MKKLIILVCLIALTLNAQSAINSFNIKVKTGLTFSGISSYILSKDFDSRLPLEQRVHTVYPGYLIGISVESGDLYNLDGTYLSFSLDLAYGKASTGSVNTIEGESEFQIKTTPFLFWTMIKTSGRISPYIKFGLGVTTLEYSEKYSEQSEFNFGVKNSLFCWGIGGGLDFNYFKYFKFNLFIEYTGTEQGPFVKLEDRREINFNYRSGTTYCGIQIGYEL